MIGCILSEDKKKPNDNKPRDGCKENNKSLQQWRNMDMHTFDLVDTERWFDVLLENNKITPR